MTNNNRVLFFGKADTLLGKCADIRDAHDRYADLENTWLVQIFEKAGKRLFLASNQHPASTEHSCDGFRTLISFNCPAAGNGTKSGTKYPKPRCVSV